MKSIGLAHWENLREQRLGTFVLGVHSGLVSIQPLLHSPHKREREQTEPDCILRYSLNNKSTTKLEELLEMSDGILISLATKRAGLHHRNETRPVLTSGLVGTRLAGGAE